MKILKLRQIILLQVLLLGFLTNAGAQLKEYTLTEKGDTINGLNKSGEKEGRWVIHTDEIRGEPGYEEEGVFKKGKKEGIWRRYNLNGDLIAVEQYLLGGKNGLQQYYTYLGDLIREEMWRAYNPDQPYDTIPVYGTGSNEIIDYKIVKAEQYSVKHGEWKYYEPGSGRLIRAEQYDRNRLVLPQSASAAPVATAGDDKPKKPAKTAEMLEWEKKNKGKKKVIRDGKTGM